MNRLSRTPSAAARAGVALVALLAIATATPRAAGAFVPDARLAPADLDVARKGGDITPGREPLRNAGPQLASFTARHGGSWQVAPNPWTGTPHLVMGSGVQWTAAAITSEAQAEAEARRFFAANPELLGAAPGELGEASIVHAMGKWSVRFQQRVAGHAVTGATAQVVFTEGGRLFVFGSDFFGGVSAAVTASLAPAAALRAATRDVAWDGAGDSIARQDLVVLPVLDGESIRHRLAYLITVRTDAPPAHLDTWVDAETGEVLWRVNQVRNLVSGTVTAETQFINYCDGTSILPDRNMYVTITGQGTATTDATGTFQRSVTGSGPFSLTASFRGPWADVNRVTGGADAQITRSVEDGVPVSLHFDDTNARRDERDCFYNVNYIHDWMKALDPAFNGHDYQMPVYVARRDGYCPGNAWYDGYSVNFCDSSGSAANTGEIGNVVYHEVGHGITAQIYGFGGPGGDLHEGNSDVVACFLENSPIVGHGFTRGQCTRGIRNLDNVLQYPADLSGEGHHDGQIIGGFHWQTWTALRALIGAAPGSDRAWDIWHYGRRMGLPQTQPDQVLWSFIADDDDGNLANGTPFFDVLCQAARHHGFSCPTITQGVMISHLPVSSKTTADATVITATITSTAGALVADSLRVVYRVEGGAWATLTMAPAGPPNTYAATIPAQPQGSQIDYYLRGADAAGNHRSDPGLAPYVSHTFDIAHAFDAFEAPAAGWQAGAGDDTATGGIWVRANPVATVCQPEDDHTATGTQCWVTGNGTPGGLPGEADVDGGKTTLLSPTYNLAGANIAKLRYYRWYNNYYGGSPATDVWKVDVSNDGGASWLNGESLNANRRVWDRVTIDVMALYPAPSQVKARFVASDYSLASVIEAAVDDFEVLAVFGATAVEAQPVTATGIPAASYLAPAEPNPFNPKTTLRYGLAAESRVELRIYDVRGTLVRTLVDTSQPAGHYALAWNGMSDGGREAPGGVYFARLSAGATTRVSKLVLAK